jgi:hypothetical protein
MKPPTQKNKRFSRPSGEIASPVSQIPSESGSSHSKKSNPEDKITKNVLLKAIIPIPGQNPRHREVISSKSASSEIYFPQPSNYKEAFNPMVKDSKSNTLSDDQKPFKKDERCKGNA